MIMFLIGITKLMLLIFQWCWLIAMLDLPLGIGEENSFE
jgi:hypothetical protein